MKVERVLAEARCAVCSHFRQFHDLGLECKSYQCTCGEFVKSGSRVKITPAKTKQPEKMASREWSSYGQWKNRLPEKWAEPTKPDPDPDPYFDDDEGGISFLTDALAYGKATAPPKKIDLVNIALGYFGGQVPIEDWSKTDAALILPRRSKSAPRKSKTARKKAKPSKPVVDKLTLRRVTPTDEDV